MCFYQCGHSMPHVVNNLSNYANMLQDRKRTATLNANAETFACAAKEKEMDNNTSVAEKEKRRNGLENAEEK